MLDTYYISSLLFFILSNADYLVIRRVSHDITFLNGMFDMVYQQISTTCNRLCCDDVCSICIAVSFKWVIWIEFNLEYKDH